MAGEFRGAVVTQGTVVGNTGTDIFNVVLPADIIAGDYLFIIVGGSVSLRVLDHEVPNGTWTNIGTSDSHARIADGTEGGTSVPFLSWNGGFTGVRAVTAIALCYRFPYTPTPGGIYGALALHDLTPRHYSNASGNSFLSGGQFGGFVGGGQSEFRIYHAECATSDITQSYNPTAATWSGDLITDRTGLIPAAGGTFPNGIDAGGDTVADAFYLSIPDTGSTHNTALDVDGPGTEGGAFMEGWAIFFPLIVVQDYWGILALPI